MKNPWYDLPKKKPFILAVDRQHVLEFNKKTKNSDFEIKLNILPDPYIGNPKASVLLLNLNPGYDRDEPRLHRKKYFINTCMRNLIHQNKKHPFYYFQDQFEKTSGYRWWTKKLKEVFEYSNLETEGVGRKIFVIEYFPYHSIKFRPSKRIPSQEYNKFLVERAIKKGSLIILMRGKKYWLDLVPLLKGYFRLFELKSKQAAFLSRKNLGNAHFNALISFIK